MNTRTLPLLLAALLAIPAVRADDRAVREGEVTLLRVTVPVQDLQLVVEAQRDTLVEYPLEPRL